MSYNLIDSFSMSWQRLDFLFFTKLGPSKGLFTVAFCNMNQMFVFRFRGWKDPRVERRKWHEGGVIRRETHGPDHLPAVQSQIHDVCQRLLQHGEKL